MITTQNLSKQYNSSTVLHIDHLEIPRGQSFGLVGNNGAGKTTFFSLLLDLIRPTSGYIENHEVKVNESEAWKPTTSAFIDESFLIGYLTPEEYFYFIGELRGRNKADIDALMEKHKKAGIIASLIGDPEVIILDEPFANLDPTTQIRLKKIIKELADNKDVTVLVSSHDLIHVTEVCERIVVLEKGEVVRDINTSTETLKELEEFFAANIAE